ncbi:ubiquitin carboxyl-terminal hydrolase 44 [Hypomesus transpacificus]|uniref:ubiquitin carboxyl-terminal hydrolase 44 n=1 Tax=Hypomesus transpacificus TaxID=137520 RepID=UPI001F07DE84|nr:ubiquitin carboxyl-terminal hydrolase 44 [Hypomesus transpacificus]XP_046879012.1 ubiquitin carboxyl-terminal hydrolase 44 [Hypomesus transpacificus]
MDRCKHVGRLRLAPDHSILNPQKWHCVDCNTTESVWACLGCAHVACGRYIEEHALQHFRQQRHPLAMEVNELYVFCYLCDDYVLNDNATGDLKLLRSTLSAIQSQRYEVTTRSGRTLRSASAAPDALSPCGAQELQLRDEDRMFTALWHRRRALLGRVFRSWFSRTAGGKAREEEERQREEEEACRIETQARKRAMKRQLQEELGSAPPRKSHRLRRQSQKAADAAAAAASSAPRPARTRTLSIPLSPLSPYPRTLTPVAHAPKRVGRPKQTQTAKTHSSIKPKPKASSGPSRKAPSPTPRRTSPKQGDSPLKRRPLVPPGVTGLRNLGNTCYMNSILQVLSHLHIFRECFLRLDLTQALELLASAVHGQLVGTVPLPGGQPSYQLAQRKGPQMGAGLSGGASRARSMELIQPKEPSSKHISLCHELHTLFQVMWSGKWALVSPFAMLHSVWQLIPAFRGYAQQDAQEFLCELLDKVQRELESTGTHTPAAGTHRRLIKQVLSVVNTIFHGQLLSQVTCLACDHRSNTVESFWDLSLEFPERYHSNSRESAAQVSCRLTEMLAKFTETEALEGNIYACDQCNSKRRRFSSKPVILTEAQKQLMVHKLPHVLRLHLKRFRWSGRNHREKIGVHVSFDQLLNMEPYCCRDSSPKGSPCLSPASPSSPRPKHFLYELSAVVMHHGKGFGSGHYTAYCYNTEGGFWVHCNDSKLNVCSVEEVCRAQAYILFYTQRVSQEKDRPL